MIEGTPLRLEVGDEELEVGLAAKFGFLGLDQVQESNFYILDTVCETAVVAVVTSGNVARVGVTEFCLVFLGVVKPFDPVVGPAAFLAFGAFLSVCKFTKFRSVDEIRASEVFSWVEVEAGLVVVGDSHLGTLKSFEVIKNQVQNLDGLTVDMISFDKSFKESPLRKCSLIFCREKPKSATLLL